MSDDVNFKEIMDHIKAAEDVLLELRASDDVKLIRSKHIVDVMLTACTFMLNNLAQLEHNLHDH